MILQKGNGKEIDDYGCYTPGINEPSFVNSVSMKEEGMDIENVGEELTIQANKNINPIIIRSQDTYINRTGSYIHQSDQQSTIYLDRQDNNILFQEEGDLLQLDDFYKFVRMQESVTFCIRLFQRDQHQLEVYGPKNTLLYVKVIDPDTSYTVDAENEIFRWIGLDGNVVRVLAFKPNRNPREVLLHLENVLAHESSAEKKMREADGPSYKMSPISVAYSTVQKNLFERYEDFKDSAINKQRNTDL